MTARHGSYSDELTAHEVRILGMIADGMENREIAVVLIRSRHTIDQQVKSILRKTGAANRTQAAVRAVRSGLLDG